MSFSLYIPHSGWWGRFHTNYSNSLTPTSFLQLFYTTLLFQLSYSNFFTLTSLFFLLYSQLFILLSHNLIFISSEYYSTLSLQLHNYNSLLQLSTTTHLLHYTHTTTYTQLLTHSLHTHTSLDYLTQLLIHTHYFHNYSHPTPPAVRGHQVRKGKTWDLARQLCPKVARKTPPRRGYTIKYPPFWGYFIPPPTPPPPPRVVMKGYPE